MEHVNNDMDDLFKKAGDLYPLKTTGSDWDNMLTRLREEDLGDESFVPGNVSTAKRFRRRWLLLLILIPLGFGSVVYFSHSEKHAGGNPLPVIKEDGNPDQAVRANSKPADTNEKGLPNKFDKPSVAHAGNLSLSGKKTLSTVGFTPAGLGNNRSGFNHEKPANSGNNSDGNTVTNTGKKGNTAGAAAIAAATIQNENTGSTPAGSAQVQDSKSNVALSDSVVLTETKPAGVKPIVKADANNTAPENASKAKPANLNKSSGKGFYIGLIGGPDLSTVKFQEVKQTGYSLGAIVGYRISKRISIESGLIWDKKYYYSSAEYFKKDPPIYHPPS